MKQTQTQTNDLREGIPIVEKGYLQSVFPLHLKSIMILIFVSLSKALILPVSSQCRQMVENANMILCFLKTV